MLLRHTIHILSIPGVTATSIKYYRSKLPLLFSIPGVNMLLRHTMHMLSIPGVTAILLLNIIGVNYPCYLVYRNKLPLY